nr:hypothetical protein CFP56_34972 [Quercus suber]
MFGWRGTSQSNTETVPPCVHVPWPMTGPACSTNIGTYDEPGRNHLSSPSNTASSPAHRWLGGPDAGRQVRRWRTWDLETRHVSVVDVRFVQEAAQWAQKANTDGPRRASRTL